MGAHNLDAVVFQLVIALATGLWRQKVWARHQRSDIETYGEVGERQRAAAHGIGYVIAEENVSESNAMHETGSAEINTKHMRGSVVLVVEGLKTRCGSGKGLIIRKAVEDMSTLFKLPIKATEHVRLAKRCVDATRKSAEGIGQGHGSKQVLLGS